MRTTRFKSTSSSRDCYQYDRYRVVPIKTKSGRKTRKSVKKKTENAKNATSFRESSKRYPIKTTSYKVVRDGTHKVAVRKRLGKKTIKKSNKRSK